MRYLLFFLVSLVLGGCLTTGQKDDDRVYVVVEVSVKDIKKYDEWLALEKPVLKKFGGKVVVDISSTDQKQRYIINSFPDSKSIDDFVNSDEFQKILPMNKIAAETKVFRGHLHEYINN